MSLTLHKVSTSLSACEGLMTTGYSRGLNVIDAFTEPRFLRIDLDIATFVVQNVPRAFWATVQGLPPLYARRTSARDEHKLFMLCVTHELTVIVTPRIGGWTINSLDEAM